MSHVERIASTFVHIRLHQRQLLLPLDNRFNVDSVAALEVKPQPYSSDPMMGQIEVSGQAFPVYHLADDFSCLPCEQYGFDDEHCSNNMRDREMILLLSPGQYRFGLLCRELNLVEASDIQLYDLPDAMRSADGLIDQVWVDQSIAVGLLYPARLLTYLISLGACSQQPELLVSSCVMPLLQHQNTLALSGEGR